jgi:hypothetical protein
VRFANPSYRVRILQVLICAVGLAWVAYGGSLDIAGWLVTGGNGDHAINPNECNDLRIVITNSTEAPVTGISAVLSFYTVLGVEITQPYSAYPDIPANSQSTNLAPFQISTLPNYICRDPINLQLSFATASHGNFVIPLTIPPNDNCTPGSGSCGFCLPTINGSITTNDPVEINRISRNASVCVCTLPKTFPRTVSGEYHYDAYTFTNASPADACVTVCVSAACDVHTIMYLGTFDSLNITNNYLGDAEYSTGTFPGSSFPFSCMVPAGATFTVVVNEVEADSGCENYTLTISGLPCPQPALSTEALPNSSAHLSWPSSAGGYILESSPSVQGGTWTVVTNEPLTDSRSYNVTNDTLGTAKFYRLHKP